MKNLYWRVTLANLQNFLLLGEKTSKLPHENIHYAIDGDFAIVQGNYTTPEILTISGSDNPYNCQIMGNYSLGARKDPLDFSLSKGINIPWLHYATRGESFHDGYGNGFHDYYFNTTEAHVDMKSQLDLLQSQGVTHIRLWFNMYHQMNADKETEGYTHFIHNSVNNLRTYLDWCSERNIQVLLCIDDSWFTFPWHWVATEKEDSYLQAIHDLTNALKNHPALWAYDYCNEPYMGWQSEYVHTHKNQQNTLDYSRGHLTLFFDSVYKTIKSNNPYIMCSVGDSKPEDNTNYSIGDVVDFYQCHWYGSDPAAFNYKAHDYDKSVIIGEYGHQDYPHATNDDFNRILQARMKNNGFTLSMIWAFDQLLDRRDILSNI